MTDTQNPAIELDYAVKLVGGNKAIVLEILADFQQEIPDYLSEMAMKHDAGRFSDLVATIHKMSGGAAYAGARHLRSLAKTIEQHFKETQQFDQDIYAQLVTELERVKIFNVE